MEPISVFDAHCDTISRICRRHEGLWSNTGHLSLKKTSGFARYCQFFALFADKARVDSRGGSMEETYRELLGCFREQMACNSNAIVQCRTAREAELAHCRGKAAAFLTVEGAELLGCDLARLNQAAEDGVVAINLTWNYANALSGSNAEHSEQGLTPLGKQFMAKMEDLHILVDVSHLSEAGFWDVTELARRPILASHSNAKSVWNHIRNLTDEQITAIIKNQGVIGLNFYQDFVGGSRNLDMLRAHLDHILELGGAANVGLGGDWDGCEVIDALPSIDRLSCFYEYLLNRGYNETVVRDLFYNNLMRVVSQQ